MISKNQKIQNTARTSAVISELTPSEAGLVSGGKKHGHGNHAPPKHTGSRPYQRGDGALADDARDGITFITGVVPYVHGAR